MTRLICLANSRRDGGRCIAGIDTESGQWIRPISPKGGAVPEEKTLLDGRLLTPLDVVEIDLDEPNYATRFQCENRRMRNWNWRLAGKANPADIIRYCIKVGMVLHSSGKIVEPVQIERLPPEKWISLQLVNSTNVRFEPDPRKPIRWQVRFSSTGEKGTGPICRNGPEGASHKLDLSLFPFYCLPVTDPEITIRLNRKEKIKPECLLTVSLTEPIDFKEYNKPALCYKLVAAVIEL